MVNAEYRYFKSASIAAFAFSDFEALEWPPKPRLDQNALMLDITLRTLETECKESLSVRCRPVFGFCRKET